MTFHDKLFVTTASMLLAIGPVFAQSVQEKNAEPTVIDQASRAVSSMTGSPLANADVDMKHVLDALSSLDPKPIEKLSPSEARQQPGASDAVQQVIREHGKSSLPDDKVTTKNILVDGGEGKVVATVYSPAEKSGPLPVIVYYHGGGFVLANNATYDATPRMLSEKVNAVVVSVDYSKAPEHRFPAAHEDAIAAYKWVTQNAESLGGDAKKIALAGESAGGNLAVNVAIAARDQKIVMPLYEVVVYPMAGTDLNSASYTDNASAKPLNKPMMDYFYAQLTSKSEDLKDPRLNLVEADLKGLPPTLLICDQIDPLQSEDLMLGNKLKDAGVDVQAVNYDGVTHEFFGMGVVVGKAKQAEDLAVSNLKKAFGV